MNSRLSKKFGTGVVIALLGILITVIGFGNDAFSQETGRRPNGPPPEAYTACEDKNAGDTAEFLSPHGDTVTGTCEQDGDRLVLRPDNPPGGRRKNNTND